MRTTPNRLSRIVAGAIVSILAAAGLNAGDWPRWRGPDVNGISKEAGWSAEWPADGPKRLWKASVGTGFSSMAVSHGRVYTLGNVDGTETLYCLDAASGREIWKHAYSAPVDPNMYEGGPNATPTVDGDVVYSFSRRGLVLALEAATGKVLWTQKLHEELGIRIPEWGFSGSPLVEGELLILNAGPAGLALHKATGRLAWSSGKDSAGYSSPVPFVRGTVGAVLLFSTKTLSAINPANGSVIWQFPWPTSYGVNAADPVLAGDRIFISSGYGQGCALLQDAGTGARPVWQNKNMRNHFNSSVAVGDQVYGFDESELKCLDLATGNVRWADRSLGKGSLIGAGGKLLILGEKGQLVVAEASPDGFKPLARAQVVGGKCWTSPVLADGRIYCRNARGELVCLDIKS